MLDLYPHQKTNIESLGPPDSPISMYPIMEQCRSLLQARNGTLALDLLRDTPFQIMQGYDDFGNTFGVLFAEVPIAKYEKLRLASLSEDGKKALGVIAKIFAEVGYQIYSVSISLEYSAKAQTSSDDGVRLRQLEIRQLVRSYIGVSAGYLGDFSYATHRDFYVDLDLDISPSNYTGTTRERFEAILSASDPLVQAKILEGILARYPAGTKEGRTPERVSKIQSWILRLRGGSPVPPPNPQQGMEVVIRALKDSAHLLEKSGPSSAVDRAHTALHGYLRHVCSTVGIAVSEDSSITSVYKALREGHPAFQKDGARQDDLERVLRSLSTILDSLNPIRNKASVAHPNPELLEAPEAMLAINAANSIFHFVQMKLSSHQKSRS